MNLGFLVFQGSTSGSASLMFNASALTLPEFFVHLAKTVEKVFHITLSLQCWAEGTI